MSLFDEQESLALSLVGAENEMRAAGWNCEIHRAAYSGRAVWEVVANKQGLQLVATGATHLEAWTKALERARLY